MPVSNLRKNINSRIQSLIEEFMRTHSLRKFSIFVQSKESIIQEICNLTKVSQRYWSTQFANIGRDMNVEIIVDRPDWSFLNNTPRSNTTSSTIDEIFHDRDTTINTHNILGINENNHLIVNGIDVSVEFHPFKNQSVRIFQQATDRNVTRDLERFLSVSSILLLNKVMKENCSLLDIFNQNTLTAIRNHIISQLNITTRIPDSTYISIKNALEDYSSNNSQLENMELDDEFEKRINNIKYATNDQVLKRVLTCLVTLSKFLTINDKTRGEAEVQSSFINITINALFKITRRHNPHCSNLLLDENRSNPHSHCRPDYKVEVLDERNSLYVNLYGEVKPISSLSRLEDLNTDTYRLGLFLKSALEKYNLQNVMSYQAIDTDITFYIMAPYEGLFPLPELDTINIPTTYGSFQDIIKDIDKIYRMSAIYQSYCAPPSLTAVSAPTSSLPAASASASTSLAASAPVPTLLAAPEPVSTSPAVSAPAPSLPPIRFSQTTTLPYYAFRKIGRSDSNSSSSNIRSRSDTDRRLRTVHNASNIRVRTTGRRSSSGTHS